MPGFVTRTDVPIFDEDEEFTPERLAEIVALNNKRILDTGDYSPIVIGHTQEDLPEDQQPELIGYAINFKLGKIGRLNPRTAILADMKIQADKEHLLEQYPRRSIELWKDLLIDPIALLGASTPRKDLGLLFSRNHEKKHRYSMSQEDTEVNPMNEDEIVKKVFEALQSSDVWSWCKEQMEASAEGAPEKTEEVPEKTEDVEKNEDEMDAEQMAEEEKDKEENKRKLQKYQRELDTAKYALAELQGQLRRADRERDLIRLETEGFLMDVKEELDFCGDLVPEKYAKHLDRIKSCYKRAPVGVNIRPARVADTGGAAEFGREQMDTALALVNSGKAKSYREAVDLVQGKRGN